MFFDNLFNDFNPFGSYSYRQPRTQTTSAYNNDKSSIILRKIQNDDYNYMCFDCHKELEDLDYFDLKNGIFLCSNCAQQHARLSKEITQPMTGKIRTLDEKDLLILYYGGNKNLFDFIKRHYPLLENMEIKERYATKAMDYYRKLLRSKIYDEPEPSMPGKKKAYTSIFEKKQSPVREKEHKNIRENRTKEEDKDDNDDNIGNFLRSTFFGDDLFNRNKRNTEKREEEEEEKEDKNTFLKTEPADINKKDVDEKDDAGMKVEKRNNSNKKEKKEQKTQKTINHEPKHKKIEKKEEKKEEKKVEKKVEKKEKVDNESNIKENIINTLTINQIGDLSRYPDAMEIDGMECECECE